MVPQPIPKSNAFLSLLAYIVVAKVLRWPAALSPRKHGSADRRDTAARDDGLLDDPLRRSHRAADLKDACRKMAHNIIQMGETTVQFLKQKGRAPQSRS